MDWDLDGWSPEPIREAPDCGRCCDRGHVGPLKRRCPDCNAGWWRRLGRRIRWAMPEWLGGLAGALGDALDDDPF